MEEGKVPVAKVAAATVVVTEAEGKVEVAKVH